MSRFDYVLAGFWMGLFALDRLTHSMDAIIAGRWLHGLIFVTGLIISMIYAYRLLRKGTT